jgi:pimeloyl-ACP methyl ester carboxylesterase
MACVFMACAAASSWAEGAYPVPLEGQYAPLKGVKLWYTDIGDKAAKEVVVMLHPNTGTSDVWSDQSRALAKAGYRAIAFDRRAWGKSMVETEADNGAQSIAEDLESLVNYLKLDQFHLVGIAGGGFASLDYAAWQQKRLKSLIVGGSTGQLSDPSMKAIVQRLEPENAQHIGQNLHHQGAHFVDRGWS